MTFAFAIFLVVHGLIHLIGFAKAFALAELPQLRQPVSPPIGIVWLIAALLFLAAAASIFVWPRGWWAFGAVAIIVSLVAIAPSWSDAKFGAIADVIALAGVLFGFLANGPLSLRAMYHRDVAQRLARTHSAQVITNLDLERLPAPVQQYLRASGVVGQPRVSNVRVRMHGRIRSGPDAPWMPFAAEQFNFFDERARLFYMSASRSAIPFQGYHRYVGASAQMQVKVAALMPVVEAAGQIMTESETVTLFNDMCVMAPQALIDPEIVWRPIDGRTVEARFTNAGHSIRAVLEFGDTGALLNFRSGDRYRASSDGKTMTRMPWSTPLRGSRRFGSIQLAAGGEGRWHEPDREYAYIQLSLDAVDYNVTAYDGGHRSPN